MIILTIDPGHTTGYAAQSNGNIVLAGSAHYTIMPQLFKFFIEYLTPDLVVIEMTPHSSHDAITSNLSYAFKELCDQCSVPNVSILPGLWKPVTPAKVANPVVAHTNDALRILHYATVINPEIVAKILFRNKKEE